MHVLRRMRFEADAHEWRDDAYQNAATNWVNKLMELLRAQGGTPDRMSELLDIFSHDAPDYLASGISMDSKIALLLEVGASHPIGESIALADSVRLAGAAEVAEGTAASTFPGSDAGRVRGNTNNI